VVPWTEENAAHLLARAGFGGDQRDVDRHVRMGQARAVERLVAVRGSGAKGPGRGDDDAADLEKLQAWWAKRMVRASARRLQEKMVLFWHDHFASSIDVVRNNLWMALQNRTFRLHGLGSFRTLVFEVTRDPAMLDFLDLRQSTRTRPNENYARELMELFVLGVSDLNGAENYTQQDVEALTRALTGFQIQNDAGVFTPSRFDGGTKSLFENQPIASGNLRLVDDAGVLVADPTRNVIDVLFAHRDSDGALTMPRFLARKLWEWFVYPLDDVPLATAKALLDEVAAPFVAGGFVVADLLRAIFLHDEFYSAQAMRSSVKNPCEFTFGTIRRLGVRTDATPLPDLLAAMGMALFDPPSVNGWSGGLAWLSTGQYLSRLRCAQAIAQGRERALRLDPTRLFDRTATTSAEVVDGVLARLRLVVPPDVRLALVDFVGPFGSPDLDTWLDTRVRDLVMLVLGLPEAHLH
jgi:uncharacterized protein (DUF1800 family)